MGPLYFNVNRILGISDSKKLTISTNLRQEDVVRVKDLLTPTEPVTTVSSVESATSSTVAVSLTIPHTPLNDGDWLVYDGTKCEKVLNRPHIVSVWAQSASQGISRSGKICWDVKEDMSFFCSVAKSKYKNKMNAFVCGRNTFEDAFRSKVAFGGVMYVVSSSLCTNTSMDTCNDRIRVFASVEGAMNSALFDGRVGKIIIVGGSRVYDETLKKGYPDTIYVTKFSRSDGDFETDNKVVQPESMTEVYSCTGVSKTQVVNGGECSFVVCCYKKQLYVEECTGNGDQNLVSLPPAVTPQEVPGKACYLAGFAHEEYQYLNLIKDIFTNGIIHNDRTGVGTRAVFGRMLRFSLKDGRLPLLTTKRTFYRGVLEELLWFMRGSTNAKELSDKKVHIWDGNGSKEFLTKRGLGHRKEGDLGPVYGYQWRHFGAEYNDAFTDYMGEGVDQLMDVVNELKHNPYSRRLVVSAWNPAQEKLMALPPCHLLFQFYTDAGETNTLSCMMYQRSADVGLGVPFNIASYSILTHIIAHLVGMQPGEFVHVMGNTHVYLNHEEGLKKQLERHPYAFPTLKIDRKEAPENDPLHFTVEDFTLVGYQCHPTIKMEMAV